MVRGLGAYFRLIITGTKMGFCSIFSAAIFPTVAFPVLLVTKSLLKKRYDGNSNIELHAK